MKRLLSIMLSFAICCNMVLSASAATISSEATLGELETQVLSYLSENHPEVLVSTESYINFLFDQLLTNSDVQLAAFENYNDIRTYMSEYVCQMQAIPVTESTNQLLALPSSVANLTPTEKRAIIAANNVEFPTAPNEQSQYQVAALSGYNAAQAVAYARTWASSNNPVYEYYLADCTNFVSQCLVAGGIPMEIPEYINVNSSVDVEETTEYWYSIRHVNVSGVYDWKVSSSFIRVNDLYTYVMSMIHSVICSGSIEAVQNYAQPGDIVQLQNEDGTWFHSIIITGGTTGDRTYCGHSYAREDAKVSSISGATSFRILRLS